MNGDQPEHRRRIEDYRLVAVEDTLGDLRKTMVSREWLDERLLRIEQAINAASEKDAARQDTIRVDVDRLMSGERSRRLAVYVAAVGGAGTLTVTLILAGAGA